LQFLVTFIPASQQHCKYYWQHTASGECGPQECGSFAFNNK